MPGEKVVVVEDDGEIRDLETFVLGAEGNHVVGGADGEAAAPTVKKEGADLVLLDLMLPGKDGNAVLADLQADPATANVPVIVVSAYTERLRATPQVKRIVPKPFDINELLEAVTRELDGDGRAT